jgi:hypothetical protein
MDFAHFRTLSISDYFQILHRGWKWWVLEVI